jgi:ornithine cyclodeaminase
MTSVALTLFLAGAAVRPVHTYSIVARDPTTGQIGVAVQSHWFSVGSMVPWAEAGVGAVATQSFVDPSYGPLGLALMKAGRSAPEALAALLAGDSGRDVRQVGLVDALGRVATHTGALDIPEAGGQSGKGYVVQANLMEKKTVWPAMARAYEAASGDLAPRMLAALDAALKADIVAPLRTHHAIDVPGMPTASLLLMPAWRAGHRIGVKLVTVYPGNRDRNERAVAAVYALFDALDGRPLALFDGEELTARRTAGASAYAAARLARADARHLVMVGAGRLARGLIEAHRLVRPIDRVSLWSRTTAHAETAAAEMADAGLPVRARRDLEAAVREADIVSCATLATAPIVRGAWLAPGTHVDLVGAFKAHMRETDDAAMQRADLIVVDDRGAALAEGGDVVQAVRSGAITESKIVAELRDFARGAHPGRARNDQVTVFKSVGFALEDLAAAEAVYDAARTGTRK